MHASPRFPRSIIFFALTLAFLPKNLAVVRVGWGSIGPGRESGGRCMKDKTSHDVAVFIEALKVPIQERGVFLERVCAGDETLRQKVEALLRAHDRLERFLDEPPTGATIE